MLIISVSFSFAAEENYLPSNILMTDAKFAHHVILVEKATHKVYVYENSDSFHVPLSIYT